MRKLISKQVWWPQGGPSPILSVIQASEDVHLVSHEERSTDSCIAVNVTVTYQEKHPTQVTLKVTLDSVSDPLTCLCDRFQMPIMIIKP